MLKSAVEMNIFLYYIFLSTLWLRRCLNWIHYGGERNKFIIFTPLLFTHKHGWRRKKNRRHDSIVVFLFSISSLYADIDLYSVTENWIIFACLKYFSYATVLCIFCHWFPSIVLFYYNFSFYREIILLKW